MRGERGEPGKDSPANRIPRRKSDCVIGRALRTLLPGGRARAGRGFTRGRWFWVRARFRESIRAGLGAGLASRARAIGRDRDRLGRGRRGGPGHDRLGLAGQEPEPGCSRVPGVDDRGSGDEVVQGAVLALYEDAQEPQAEGQEAERSPGSYRFGP